MPEQQLNGTEVLGSPVDQRRLGAPHRVRAVVGGIESQFLNPASQDSRVLPRPKVRRVVDATRKQEVVRPQTRLLDPLLDSVSCCGCHLKLNGALSLVLHDDGPRCDLVTVADVPTLRLTRSHPRSLLSIPTLKRASSRTRLSICRRTRSAQTSLTLNGDSGRRSCPCSMGRVDHR
jgi:hypothetical protein